MQLFSTVSSAIAIVVSLGTVTTSAVGATVAMNSPYSTTSSTKIIMIWWFSRHTRTQEEEYIINQIKWQSSNLPRGREERKEKNNYNDCVQNWSPTSVRKDEQSSRNKKLGSPTRWRSNKYFPSLILKSCNLPLTHIVEMSSSTRADIQNVP